ncbi:MAG: ABC transporter ATP-binding protein [Candidatus Heimdallarchaeota archaeon]|nr:MAG: ABC transporter ATP-binding protein [Candidatus Heimdallarchaeota archaeon]
MKKPKIKIQNLTKYYGKSRGIENLSLEIMEGEIFGFLGPNGAGKTTTIRCMINILLPTSGNIWINGNKVTRKNPEIRENIGYIPGEFILPENYTVNEFLSYIQNMRKNPSKRRNELVERFTLPQKKKIGELSKGNKQKVGIVAALMHDPEILILDEPTSGLDPLLQQELYTLLLESKKEGKTIFFSSHNLSEVQRICDRVAIIKEGTLVKVEEIHTLNKNVSRKLEVQLKHPNEEQLRALGANLLEIQGDKVSILVPQSASIKPFLENLLLMEPEELSYPPASLEDYFMQFYKTQK